MSLNVNENTWKEKLLREQIHDPDYSAWLIANMHRIAPSQWINLAMHAAMPIQEKNDYFRTMLYDRLFIDEEKAESCTHTLAIIRDCIEVLTAAIDLTDPQKQPDDKVFQCTYKDRSFTGPSAVHKTFRQVLDAIRKENEDAAEFDSTWYVVTCYQLRDGLYREMMRYIVSAAGNIWNVKPPRDEGESRSNIGYSSDMASLDLPTPFQPGDILTYDCYPFREMGLAVVIRADNIDGRLFCIGDIDGNLVYYCVQDVFSGDFWCSETFSPFLSIRAFHGVLRGGGLLYDAVSRFIRSHPDGTEEIERYCQNWRAGLTEESLYRLMKEYDRKKKRSGKLRKDMKILNLHGFLGKADNRNYQALRKLLPDAEIISPKLDFLQDTPQYIFSHLLSIVKQEKIDLIVGRSLGAAFGLLTAQQCCVPCILTNPCLEPQKTKVIVDSEIRAEILAEYEKVSFRQYYAKAYILLSDHDEIIPLNSHICRQLTPYVRITAGTHSRIDNLHVELAALLDVLEKQEVPEVYLTDLFENLEGIIVADD